eukprot:TRINITY_DN13634_c0_g1_i1.p1 TRINITY_DN13634_c0_g1~~TRINITY_DN13634_c0_g1_i1.p1  ORF type:complete len:220 (+),score=42.64 TRINITY_DN13634_c0_g1_i1:69-662(+)
MAPDSGVGGYSGADAPTAPSLDLPKEVGSRVRLRDLQSRPDMNGLCGTLESFDTQKGRWAVKLDGETAAKSFKADNVVVVPPGPGPLLGAVRGEEAAATAAASMSLRLASAVKADRDWCKSHDVDDPDLPTGLSGIDSIWWHIHRNVCGNNLEKADCAKYAIAHIITKPEEKDKLTLDDPKMAPRLACFLRAFRDAA